ncbi:Hypothetical protein GLP15_293 [Giardia lamblia P15]|uniref:Nop14-like family protein n=1 Tax=Giardia intestinalis (strain P15) TaxID=658858 RepID=E1F3M7_GIAIA|nr:Hypothetical protein GLP15_293 [Giardia lamblia P15]
MGKPAHLKLQAKLDMVKRKMGVEDGKLNPFDHIKVNTRRQVLNKGEHKYKHTCAKSVTEVIKKPLGSAGNNVHVIADINDERIVPKQGEKGYSYQRSELIRHSVNQIPQKFDFPDNTRPDERIFYEREMRQRARDVYAEVRAKAKAYREEHKRINRDVSEAVQQLDRAYGTMSRLLPKETRLGSQSIVAEFQPLDGVRVHASRGATNLADAVRACAETLEKMDKDRSTIPAIRPKLDHKQSTNISSNDPECLNGDFNLGDNFSSDTPEESDTQIGTEHDEQSDADDTREHQLPHFLCREVQPTYFEKLSFSLPVPSTMDDFQIMLDSVQSIEEILVLDRLIKSNSTLVDGSNRPEMERLASFCTTRFMYLIYDAPELDPVRIDAQARGLRHITSEIPHYMMSAYQKLILTYHKAVQAVNFMGIFLCNQEALKSKCSNKKKRIECLDSVFFSPVSVTSKKTESYDEQQNEFLSLHGRAIFGGVMLSNLMALVFPQGTWYTLSPDEFTLTNMRVFEEQPLYTAMFLANDTPIQGMCLRLEQTLLAIEDTVATMNNSMLCTIYQETLLLQALVLTTLMLSNATQLHIPSVSRGLESILHVYSSLFARSIVVANTPKAIFQSITASYIILGVPTEHKIELLPSLFQDGLTFTLGNILAGFSAVINACFLQLKIAKKYNLSSQCSFLLPVCKELRSHLVPSENFDVPGTQFSIQWALNSLVETLSSEGEDQSLSWIEDRLPEIKANEPMYMVDFRPGKNMDPNKARERARVEEKCIKKQKRDEERSARREIRQKAVLRTEQKLKLKTGRERAANRVQHMLEVDQHSYKDLDAARARLLKKRGASGRVGKK